MTLKVMVDAIPEEAGTAWVMIYDRETDFINGEADQASSGISYNRSS